MSRVRLKKVKLFRSTLLKKKTAIHLMYNLHHIEQAPTNNLLGGIKRYNFILASLDFAILNYNQIEACRKIISRRIRRLKPKGFYILPLKFTLPCTEKSKNSRMGKGKGSVVQFVTRVKAFDTIFVLRNLTYACAARILLKVVHKLPMAISLFILPTREFKQRNIL
jgi:ribosomal protein L16/L10AE